MQFLSLDSTAAVQVFDACMHSLAQAYRKEQRETGIHWGRCALKIFPCLFLTESLQSQSPTTDDRNQGRSDCLWSNYSALRDNCSLNTSEEKSKARWWNSSLTHYYSLREFTLIHVLNSHLSPTKKSTCSSWNVNDDANKWIANTVPARFLWSEVGWPSWIKEDWIMEWEQMKGERKKAEQKWRPGQRSCKARRVGAYRAVISS